VAKQQTRWLFKYPYKNGLLRAGWIHNLNPATVNNPRDNVRLRWSLKGRKDIDLCMRPDEALAMAAGLSWVVGEKVLGAQEVEAQKRITRV